MDIKQLQFLCALDEHRHFGRAAEACHVTQPTLSMRIKNLEEELGLELIERRQRFEGFTPAGERLLVWAHQAVSAYSGIKVEASRLRGTLVGTLRIGMVPLSHVHLLPLLRKLRDEAPQLNFQLQSLSSGEIHEQLLANQIDVGLTYLSDVEPETFRILPLGRPPVGLMYQPDRFDLDGKTPLTWKQVSELPLGLLTPSMRFRQSLDQAANKDGIFLQPVLESDAVEHLIESTHMGLCCTLVPLPAPDSPLMSHLAIQPLEAPSLPTPLAMIALDQRADRLVVPLMKLMEELHQSL